MLHLITWSWGTKYGPEYVERLEAGIARNLSQPYRFHVCHPQDEDLYLTEIPGCFARLRTFDEAWQAQMGIASGDRIVCFDLDLVVTGDLSEIVSREEPFVILQGVNAKNPGIFNGSLWSLAAGYRPDVWGEFSLELAQKISFFSFPDDQAWLEDMMPDAAAFGAEDGAYAFQKKNWPKGEALPRNARIVAFPGWRDPSQYVRLDWVQQHWR